MRVPENNKDKINKIKLVNKKRDANEWRDNYSKSPDAFWIFFLNNALFFLTNPNVGFHWRQSEAIYWWIECSILDLEKRREYSAQRQAGWYKAWTPCVTCVCLRIRESRTRLRQQSVLPLVKINEANDGKKSLTCLFTSLLHGFSCVYTRGEIFAGYINVSRFIPLRVYIRTNFRRSSY